MDVNDLADGDFAVFIRLGSDYKNNYYEYEVPLKLTPHGEYNYNNSEHQKIVWPAENMLNFRLEILTDLKLERNREKRSGTNGVSFQTVYSGRDPDNDGNTIRVKGNPSLSEVKTVMIGVRNVRNKLKSGEVWVNELRLTDFNEEGGWAANANLNVALSDLGTVNVGGRIETAGFGALDQSLNERRMEDFKQYNVATSIELGKLFPEKAQVSIPFYYAYSKETYDPKYNPLDQDVKLKDAIDKAETKAEKDSIRDYSQDRTVIKSVSFNNVRVNIKSKNPMPYDPANFTLGYSYSINDKKNPETEYETTKDYKAAVSATLNNLPKLKEHEGVVFMGHGTYHESFSAYCALEYIFQHLGVPIYVGTVEGYPTLDEVLYKLQKDSITQVYLAPFMLVAGDHAINDMAGDEEDSWKVILSQHGIQSKILLQGLGENKEIQKLFINHALDCVNSF